MKTIDEIGLEYAYEHGGGLPLTAKEFCNALALWVQNNCVLKDNNGGSKLTLEELYNMLSSTDTITLNNNGQKIEFHLNAEVLADVQRSLKFPVSNPTETEIVGVDELGQQVMIPQSQLGGKLYNHSIALNGLSGMHLFSFTSPKSQPYTKETIKTISGMLLPATYGGLEIYDATELGFIYLVGGGEYQFSTTGSVVFDHYDFDGATSLTDTVTPL